MIDSLATVLTVAALALAAWSLVVMARDRTPGDPLLIALAVLEVGLLVQVVIAVARLAGGHRPDELVTFVGYLVAALIVLPAGALWSLAERSRWGTGVLTVACLVVPVLILRLEQTWQAAGG